MTTEYRHILMLSGGKDSTALALYMRDKRPDINFEYIFCDTHKELPETYEYLARIEAYLGRPITRLSSGLGERGFDHFLKVYGGYLPAPSMRWCTKKMKIEPFEQYIGDDPAYLYIGIRADERREGYVSTKPNLTPLYPFKEDGLRKEDVMALLDRSGVGLPKYYEWRSRSGCYFCFFQQRAEWIRLRERHPDLYELAKAYEKPEKGFTWSQGESLSDLENPDRIAEIQLREQQRLSRIRRSTKPKTLAESLGGLATEGDEPGCLVCHL
jgi:3'-phosphoadenosine 5'-phosphosulfate sulfotransferase (PAPS reductase)/FAD synthetase